MAFTVSEDIWIGNESYLNEDVLVNCKIELALSL